jgi:hypothetical protein
MFHRLRWLILILSIAALPSLPAQQPKNAAAPIPATILNAKRILITNGGSDITGWQVFQRAGTPNEPYNAFYLAMKDWAHYELVNDPANADLVFEISFAAPLTDTVKLSTYSPHLRLTIIDAKTHVILWSMLAPVEGAFRKVTWEKNYASGVTNLMTQLKTFTVSTQAVGDGGR